MLTKRWLIVTIFTFITVLAWVVFEILHARTQVEIPPKTKELIEPINPGFNLQSVQSLP